MDSYNGVVRTAAVLHLDSPRASDARGSASTDGASTPPRAGLAVTFDRYCLPTLHGGNVFKYLSGLLKSEEASGEKSPPRCAQVTEVSPLSEQQRLEALLRSLDRTYVNLPGAVQAEDGWSSLLPDGPFAVAALTLPYRPPPLQPHRQPPATNPTNPALPAPPPATAPFPPPWLHFLSRSLTFLDLSGSTDLDPAGWDLSALKALPLLTLLCLREAQFSSPLPAGLLSCLPALRVLDLCDAHFHLPEEQVAAMMLQLSEASVFTAACGAGRHTLPVITTAAQPCEYAKWMPKSLHMELTAQGRIQLNFAPVLRIWCQPPSDCATPGATSDGATTPAITSTTTTTNISRTGAGSLIREKPKQQPKLTRHMFTDMVAIRAVWAARERAFLASAREAWWEVTVRAEEEMHLVPQPLDFSMVALLYDLGLLPPPAEPAPAGGQSASAGGSGGQAAPGGQAAAVDAGGAASSGKEDFGAEFAIKTQTMSRLNGSELTLDFTCLELAWPFTSSRWDAPSWSHEQKLHSRHREGFEVHLTTRQWKLWMETARPGVLTPTSGDDEGDPFAAEVLAFQALEDRERLASGVLYAACIGSSRGLLSLGIRHNKEGRTAKIVVSEAKAVAKSRARPAPESRVMVPTATALAARTRARRLLVAGLLGSTLAEVTPAERGTVTMTYLMLAVRMEARLYSRVRRVSLLPRSHPAYTATHAERYWASVKSLHELLRCDPLVRRGVLTGAVKLAAATEIPAADLRALVRKLDMAARKGQATRRHGGVGTAGDAMVLAEKTLAAADLSDLAALQKQVSVGGRLDEPMPIFPEDWLPSERSADSLCAWHIMDPWVWPHGTVLHTATALGHVRTAGWLLSKGLNVDCRISRWELTSLHLCCLMPCIWPHMDAKSLESFIFVRIPKLRPGSSSDGGGDVPANSRGAVDGKDGEGNSDDNSSDDDNGDEYSDDDYSDAARIFHRTKDALRNARVDSWDQRRGAPAGAFLRHSEIVFERVCGHKPFSIGINLKLGPLWCSSDDDIKPLEVPLRNGTRSPFLRALPCTAPAASAAADAASSFAFTNTSSTSSPSASVLASAASPMMRLLLSHAPNLELRSWSGLTPLHYAAATSGPEAVVALVQAGASLAAQLPGSLKCALHLLAHRSWCQFSGISSRVTTRLMALRPLIPSEELVGRPDEWRGCPLSYLLRGPHDVPPANVLGELLQGLPAGLRGHGARGGDGGKLSEEVLHGLARTLATCIVQERPDEVQLLIRHFPEAVSVPLPPMQVTSLHLAAYMLAWEEREYGSPLRWSVFGEPCTRGIKMPRVVRANCYPYIDPNLRADPSGKSPPKTSVSGVAGRELLVLEGGSDAAAAAGGSNDVAKSGGAGSPSDVWNVWPYPLLLHGPKAMEGDGKDDMAVIQRCMSAQIQVMKMLLDAGASIDARDVMGYTPLMVAILAGTAPVVAYMLERGASLDFVVSHITADLELITHNRLNSTYKTRDHLVLGLDVLLFGGETEQQQLRNGPRRQPRKTESRSQGVEGGGCNSGSGSEGKEEEGVRGSAEGSSDDSEDQADEDDESDEDDYGKMMRQLRGRSQVKARMARKWKRPAFAAMGDEFLAAPPGKEGGKGAQLTFQQLLARTVVSPLSVAVMRVMQNYTCCRHQDETGPGTGMQMDGKISSWHLKVGDRNATTPLIRRHGDGILYLLLKHGGQELREKVLQVLRQATATNVVEMLPRTSIWMVREIMPEHHFVSYADRAAQEACSVFSHFTLDSLDAAIQKALGLVLEEAGRSGRQHLAGKEVMERQQRAKESLGSGAPPWGPEADEVLGELVNSGLYPLFMSKQMTNGEGSILRMSAQLLQLANSMKVGRRALLQEHIRQFTRSGGGQQRQKGGNSMLVSPEAPGTTEVAMWALDNIELLPVESFNFASSKSQQRVIRPGAGRRPHGGVEGDGGGRDGGGGVRGLGASTVVGLHTLDDVEYGLMYARAGELMPPVTSMRTAFGHKSSTPSITIRALAQTMFKFVRTLCHVAQDELEWIRLPGGVTFTAVDGLYGPILPGDSSWNVTDMFRPRNFGFRLSFTYTRRSLMIELHALSLMRTVPIDVQEDGATVEEGGGTSTLVGGAAVEAGTSPQGPRVDGAAGKGLGDREGEVRDTAAASTVRDGMRVRRAGAAPVLHSRGDEMGFWMRNPDVVRMQQVQTMAGRLESVARLVGGNWRQMPTPPPWWITGWVDRFLRLFVLIALNKEDDKVKSIGLHTLHDPSAQDPCLVSSGCTAPWSRLETNVLGVLLQLQPLKESDSEESEMTDLAGKLLTKQEVDCVSEVLESPICLRISSMIKDSNPDRGVITFTAQWNKLAHQRHWPLRSTSEVQDLVHRLVRLCSCSYTSSWHQSLQVMMGLLMSGSSSPELRRETEAKLLSLASDAAFARRLVWGTCRGRLADARALALLSGVVEFQPLLLEAILEHEQEMEALEQWSPEGQHWTLAGGPALQDMELEELSLLLQETFDLDYRPAVQPYNAEVAATTTAAGVSQSSSSICRHLMYCCFRTREDLQRAVAVPLMVPPSVKRAGVSMSRGGSRSSTEMGGPGSLLALLPVSLWEAGAVPAGAVPRRHDSVALPFFRLVFSRLPTDLKRVDSHVLGVWGSGLRAVLLHRRPAAYRWAPWGSPPDVAEEAAVVGTLFDAHAAKPLPKSWMKELDTNDDGELSYREFLMAYVRHKGGDFLGPRLATNDGGATANTTGATTFSGPSPEGAIVSVELSPDTAADVANGQGGDGDGNENGTSSAAARGWQVAARAMASGQLSQAFWDRANALNRLRNRDDEAMMTARKEALMRADQKGQVADGRAGGGMSAVRQLGALALEALGGGMVGVNGTSPSLPLVALAGLDSVIVEEISDVQRCAWVVYGNLRAAARYLQTAHADGYIGPGTGTGGGPILTHWQTAERTALESVMRGLKNSQRMFDQQHERQWQQQSEPPLFGPQGPRSWLQALSGAVNPVTRYIGEVAAGGSLLDVAPMGGRFQVRDVVLLDLLLDLSCSARGAAHTDVLHGVDEGLLVGPLPGPSHLLRGRRLAEVAVQLGADCAEEVASAVGAMVMEVAREGSAQEGLSAPVGGLDEVFCASALRLVAEEIWAFVMDMQALIDQVLSPLVAAADQSVPIIPRESITTMFGATNIEIIVEYEMELLKLLTVQWRVGCRTGLVGATVAGPVHYLVGSTQRRVAAAKVRAFGGEFPPDAEELGLDPLAAGAQLRVLLTNPEVASDVLEMLLRLANAYQNYLDNIDAALQELVSCVDRDEKGAFTTLLRRFSHPVKVKSKNKTRAVEGKDGAAVVDDVEGDAEDSGGEEVDDDVNPAQAGSGAPVAAGTPGQQAPPPPPPPGVEAKSEDRAFRTVRLASPSIHHVRPLLSVRQMARYGPGAEVEACLRKPASHLATLAFLAAVCRSISTAQEQLAVVQAAVGDGGDVAKAPGEAVEASVPRVGLRIPPTTIPTKPQTHITATTTATGSSRAAMSLRFRFSKRPEGGGRGGGPQNAEALRPAAVRGAGGGVFGAVRRMWQLVVGLGVSRVLPLGTDLHPLFKVLPPGYSGLLRFAPATTAEHRVALRCVGAAVLVAEGDGKRLGSAPRLGERLDVWMEQRLLEGTWASRVLLVVCTVLTCLTWRVVPLLSERKRYLEELRTANNLMHHRQVIRQLERAINVRPTDDDLMEAELKELHRNIVKKIEESVNEVDFDAANLEKRSPMDLESGFWDSYAPKRRQDPEALRAALRLAEEYTLHSTFAGARLLSNARRCAARLAAVDAISGGAKGKGRAGAAGNDPGLISDEEEDLAASPAVPAGGVKKASPPPPPRPPPPPAVKKSASAVLSGDSGKGGGGDMGSGPGGESTAGGVLNRLFANKKGLRERGARAGGPKLAWGGIFGGTGSGGMAAAVGIARKVKSFVGALRRAVKRREHARRRWDKTLFLVMQSGAIDEDQLSREHAIEVARLRRSAALMAWQQLRGSGSDMLMVFGEVVFRDVGRWFALAMAAFLMTFPFAVLAVALKVMPSSLSDRRVMAILLGCYVVVGFMAMVAAVAGLRKDPSQLKVYHPSDTIRFPNFRKGTTLSSWKDHWVNVFALVNLVLEFWQLCAFSYQRRVPYPKASMLKAIFPWALLDLGPAAYYLQVFALLAFMVVWIAVFFPQTPTGLKRVIIPFLGQAAYLTITSGLLSQLNCRMDDGALVRKPNIQCWTDPRHLYGAVAAMLALGLFVPRATLTPFEVFFPSENLDIKYRGLYVRMVQIIRLGMAGYNLFLADTFPLSVMLANACVCGLLAALTAIMKPCCIGAVDIGRGTGFVLATWSQIVSVTALRFSRKEDVHMSNSNRQWYTTEWNYVYMLGAGWVVIAAGGYLLLRRHLIWARSSAIRFSLKASPFNYTRLRLMETPAGPTTSPSSATTARAQQQLPAPKPLQRPQSVNSETDAASSVASSMAASSDAPSLKLREGAIPPGALESERGAADEDSDGSDKAEEDGPPAAAPTEASTVSYVGGDGSNGDSISNREGAPAAADSEAADTAQLTALGLPIMSLSLIKDLTRQGLLTPADEMRVFMAKLVRRAKQALISEGSSDDDDDDEVIRDRQNRE